MSKDKFQKPAYYLAYFEINQDKDFYVELYKDLNYDYKLFENPVDAINAVKKHLKLAIDTFRTSKGVEYVKEVMEEFYNDPLTWEVEDTDQDEIIFLIDESLGNYDIKYEIRRVSFLDKKH